MNSRILLHPIRPVMGTIFRSLLTKQAYSVTFSPLSRNSKKFEFLCAAERLPLTKVVMNRPCRTLPKLNKVENHSTTWTLERVFSLGAITSTICMVRFPGENTELFWVFVLVLHIHWGLESILTDYLRPSVVGTTLPKFKIPFCMGFSILLLTTLAWIAIHGNGILRSMQQLWYLDTTRNPYPIVVDDD